MKVFTTAKAKSDIDAIGNWIAEDNPKKAISFVNDIRKACANIGEMPRGYVVVQRYLEFEVRKKPFRDYLIFYRIVDDTVEILHVVSGARDYSQLF